MAGAAFAQTASVKVEGAWARATVQGQKGTGAFMKLTAPEGARLVTSWCTSPAEVDAFLSAHVTCAMFPLTNLRDYGLSGDAAQRGNVVEPVRDGALHVLNAERTTGYFLQC